jgi:adenylosuccinate synthase
MKLWLDGAKLPENAKKYLKRIEKIIETTIDIISTGPDRVETILINPQLFV